MCVSIQPVCNRISDKRNFKTNHIFHTCSFITTQMKRDYTKLSICDTNTGNSPAELKGTGDPDRAPASGKQ
jgi:hypothetical protein